MRKLKVLQALRYCLSARYMTMPYVSALRFFYLDYISMAIELVVQILLWSKPWGAGCAVLAHNNKFNKWVAGAGGAYFDDTEHCTDANG